MGMIAQERRAAKEGRSSLQDAWESFWEKLTSSGQRRSPEPMAKLTSSPEAVRIASRRLSVEVSNGRAAIVETLEGSNGSSRVRRLSEQFLTHDLRAQADRLKWHIVFEENAATYGHNGLYSPQSGSAGEELLRLVEELERRDGPGAWDRRRYPR